MEMHQIKRKIILRADKIKNDYEFLYLFPINPAVSSEIANAIVRSVLGSLDHLIIKKNITLFYLLKRKTL